MHIMDTLTPSTLYQWSSPDMGGVLKISVLYTRLSLSFTVVFSLTIYILLLSLLDQLYSPTIDTSVPQSFHIRCARLRYVYLTVFDLYLTHTHS